MPKQNTQEQYATKTDLKDLRTELKGDMKQFRDDINENIKTHTGVLFEKFFEEVTVLAEAHQDTNRRVRSLETRTSSLEDKMDTVIDTLGEVKVSVNEIKDQLQTKVDLKDRKLLERRVSAIEIKI